MLVKHTQRLWDTPLYADFPRSEFENRIHGAKKHMAEQKIDMLVLWDPVNIRYFTGYQSLHWSCQTIQPAVFLLALDQDPVMIAPDFFAGVVEGYTYATDIRLILKPHVTDNIRRLPALVAETIKEMGYAKSRIGLESGYQGGMSIPRPLNDIDLFRNSLPDADFIDGCDLIWKCRIIKSDLEVTALKKATQAVVRAYGDVVAKFELGMSERDIGRMLRNSILQYTEDCMPPIATSSSRRIIMPDTPSFYDEVSLSMGDRIVFEPLPTYKGYYGSCCRVFQIGPTPDEAQKKAEAVDKAQEAAISAIRPGIQTKVLMEIIESALKEEGIDPTIEMAGHGVGLSPHEPPMIAENEEQRVEENMVLAIEVWVVDWSGVSMADSDKNSGNMVPEVYGNEDLVLVTKNGCDRFPSFRKDIRSLPFRGYFG